MSRKKGGQHEKAFPKIGSKPFFVSGAAKLSRELQREKCGQTAGLGLRIVEP
jgi:hypothetical protein